MVQRRSHPIALYRRFVKDTVAVSRFNWALGGGLAGLAGVLIGPVTVVNIGTFSFLLVKAVNRGEGGCRLYAEAMGPNGDRVWMQPVASTAEADLAQDE